MLPLKSIVKAVFTTFGGVSSELGMPPLTPGPLKRRGARHGKCSDFSMAVLQFGT